jgi:phytoene dehydrogenase-like protein
MPMKFGARPSYDAVIVGSGPNGLAAALVLAQAGLSTLVIEAHDTPGGGTRTAALTLPGFRHDVCSTVHPLAVASPFFRRLNLAARGVRWCEPPLALAHVLRDGSAVTLTRSLTATASGLGEDEAAYLELMSPFVARADDLLSEILKPLGVPRSPLLLARFGLVALGSLSGLANRAFSRPATKALLAGMGAHAMQPLTMPTTASFALVLALAAHRAGWPVAAGGSDAITRALVEEIEAHGGELCLGQPVTGMEQLPDARAYLFDVTPRQLVRIARPWLPARYIHRLARFKYGPGIFKMDWALSGPVPWLDPTCARAGTVHLSGNLEDVAEAEAAVSHGRLSQRPFVIFVQPSLFDTERAPPGAHTAWAYCHVPWGSTVDASQLIEQQIERFAPGFQRLVLARHSTNSAELERYNPNYVGGDINGGSALPSQLFTRPVLRLDPYSTPNPRLFLCSSSTPPGGGVHGMCGYWAARSVLRRVFGRASTTEL